MKTIRVWTPITFASIMMLTGAAAQAQDAPTPAPATPPAAASDAPAQGGLDEIVVTAQRRSENLQRVPIAVTAISGTQLAAAGVVNTMQLGTAVPGVSIRNSTGSFQPFVRGVGTSTSLVENPVALYIDNVYYPVQREGVRDLVGLQQIAILKGPQGTLFGRNATGGVVQITTRDPSTVKPALELSTSIDNYLTWKSNGYVSTPIGAHSAIDLSGSYTTQGEGWGTDFARNEDIYKIYHDYSVRAKALISDGDKFKAVLIGDYGNRRDSMLNFRPVEGTKPIYAGFYEPGDPRDSVSYGPGRYFIKSGGASANVSYNLDFAHLVSITSYRQGVAGYTFDTVGVPQPTILNLQHQTWRDLTQEVQLVSNKNSPLSWTIGAFYFRFRDLIDPFEQQFSGPAAPLPTSTKDSFSYANELVNSFAAFAQATWEFAPGTKLTGGIRWTTEKRDFIGSILTQTNNAPLTQTYATNQSISANRVTWRAAIDHQLSQDVLIYASYNRGFKSGGFNLNSPKNPPYLPEQIDAYESGVKTELFDRRIRFNLSGFYYDYKNVQVTNYVVTGPVVTNGAAARIYGGEAELQAVITDHLHANAALSLLHSTFQNYPSATCSTQLPAGGISTFSCSAKGNRTPFSQRYVLTMGLDYTTELAGAKITANVTNSVNDGYYTEADNFLYQPKFDTLNASVTFALPGDRWSVKIFAQNLLDEDVATIKYTGSPRAYLESYGNPPLTVGAMVKFSY